MLCDKLKATLLSVLGWVLSVPIGVFSDVGVQKITFQLVRIGWLFLNRRILPYLSFGLLNYVDGSFREQVNAANNYSRSAQVVRVWFKGNSWAGTKHSLIHFIYEHVGYVDPHYVLEDDDVTLMGIEAEETIFCKTGDPEDWPKPAWFLQIVAQLKKLIYQYLLGGVPEAAEGRRAPLDLYDSDRFPFVFMAQYLECKYLVILPNESAERLAVESGPDLDRDPRNISLINMTMRSGSTLIVQCLSKVPGVRVQSEPWAFVHLHGLYTSGVMDWIQFRKMVKVLMVLQCKFEPSRDSFRHDENSNCDASSLGTPCRRKDTHLVIKTTAFMGPMFRIIKEFYPHFTCIYNTRNVMETIQSLMKVTRTVPQSELARILLKLRLINENNSFLLSHAAIPYQNENCARVYQEYKAKRSFLLMEENFALTLGGNIREYLDNMSIYKLVIMDTEIMTDDKEAIRNCITKLLRALDLDAQYVDVAMQATWRDSQRGILAKRGSLHISIPRENLDKVDAILAKMIPETRIRTTMSKEEYERVIRPPTPEE